MTEQAQTDSLAQVAEEAAVCTLCELSRSRTQAVPGQGSATARVMLIGEGPGHREDQAGEPFVGASGKFLTELLTNAGLSREEVFITNVVKCRPPGNRDPLPDEIAACRPYLQRQIALIDPDVIVTLGRFSMSHFFPGERISKIHGQPKEIGERLYVPMYHPAAALHQGALRATIQDDFNMLPKFLAERERKREKQENQHPPASQSTLF